VTAEKFRSLALEIPGAVESSHMNHPDFRLGGKVFASLGYPDDEHGMVSLTPDQQRVFMKKAPSVFAACAGMWGKRGATNVYLGAARVEQVRSALSSAAKRVTTKTKG
jgi:hypothetical protein